MTQSIRVGELVRPRADSIAATRDAIGIVTQVRRDRVCVWFPERFQQAWIPVEHLNRLIWKGDPRGHHWALIAWLIQACEGIEFEYDAGPPVVLHVRTDSMDRTRMQQITDFLGPRLSDWSIRPASMSSIWVVWVFNEKMADCASRISD